MTATPSFIEYFQQLFRLDAAEPSLQHLSHVADKFALIPYENLTKIIRVAVTPDGGLLRRLPHEVLSDFGRYGSGGTCFSLTYCLQAVLRHYGYECGPRMADLGRQTNNHCALVVALNEQEYLIDPGYLITRPLPIPASGTIVHPTRLHPVRLEREPLSDCLNLATLEPDGAKHRYRMKAVNCSSEAFDGYWKDSFSWNMMYSLLVTRVIEDGRFYLHDRHARWFDQQGRKTTKVKESYDVVVSEYTGISVDLVRKARTILAETKRSMRQNGVDENG